MKKKSISERAIIGFDHGLPCRLKNMALGPQLRQKPRPSASVFVYWVPRAMFFTRHGRPWSNPTTHLLLVPHICVSESGFHSWKCIWKYHLQNGGHVVQGEMSWVVMLTKFSSLTAMIVSNETLVMLMKFSSLAAPEVIKIKKFHEASDENSVNLMTLSSQLGPFQTWHNTTKWWIQQKIELGLNFEFTEDVPYIML